jgi:hypothetical protein
MTNKLRGLTAAALAATALFAAQPAAADTITLSGWWAGHSGNAANDRITYSDGTTSINEFVNAGGFTTTNSTTGNTFQSFCVDIFHSFGFSATSNSSVHPTSIVTAAAAEDLGRLYSNHGDLVASTSSTAANEAAFQLAVWEIVNEGGDGSYGLSDGKFQATGADAALAQTWLTELVGISAPSNFKATVWSVDSVVRVAKAGDYPQDIVVFAPVPEPQTYAMMLVGLGLLGFSARRKNQNLG